MAALSTVAGGRPDSRGTGVSDVRIDAGRAISPTEAVAIGRECEEREREKAKERQREHGKTAPGKKKNTGGNLPPVTSEETKSGKTRDRVAEDGGPLHRGRRQAGFPGHRGF